MRKVKHGRHVENLENEKLIEALMHRPAWLATRGQRARSRVDEEEEQEQWPGNWHPFLYQVSREWLKVNKQFDKQGVKLRGRGVCEGAIIIVTITITIQIISTVEVRWSIGTMQQGCRIPTMKEHHEMCDVRRCVDWLPCMLSGERGRVQWWYTCCIRRSKDGDGVFFMPV